MRRWIMIPVALIWILCLLPFVGTAETDTNLTSASSNETEALVGVWVASGAEAEGEILTWEDGEHRDSFVLELREDGTLSSAITGIRSTGTWSVEEGLLRLEDGTEFAFVSEENRLRVEVGDSLYIFLARTEDSFEEVLSGASDIQDALIGRWRLTMIESDSGETRRRAALDAEGYDMTVEFTADGTMTMVTWLNGEEDMNVSFGYEVSNSDLLMLDGDYPVRFSLNGSLLAIVQRGGVYYYLPWSEPDPDDTAAEEAGLIGVWRLESYRDADGSHAVNREMMDLNGFDETLEFTADGRSIMTIMESNSPSDEQSIHNYVIEQPGIIVLDGHYVERYAIEGDTLTITETTSIMVFKRVTSEEAEEDVEPALNNASDALPDENEDWDTDEEPFDAIAALTGRWQLDGIEYDDGDVWNRLDLTLIDYSETVEFTADGSFNLTASQDGKIVTDYTKSYELTGANFMTLDGSTLLPFGFSDGRLVLIRQDGKYYYIPEGEIPNSPADEYTALIDESLLGLWKIESLRITDEDGGIFVLDRKTMDALDYNAFAEFSADGVWTNSFYDADGNIMDQETLPYAVTAPGVLLVENDYHETYTIKSDTLTITGEDTVMVFTRVKEARTDEAP